MRHRPAGHSHTRAASIASSGSGASSMSVDEQFRRRSTSAQVADMVVDPAQVLAVAGANARPPSIASNGSAMSGIVATPVATDGLENEVIPVLSPTVSDQLIADVVDMMEGLTTTGHPFIPLIQSDRINPRLTVLLRYIALIGADTLIGSGICPWCYADESLSDAKRNKKYASISPHVYSCVADRHPDHWQCPICLDLVPLPLDEDKEEDDVTWTTALEDHQKRCFEQMLVALGLKEVETTDFAIDIEVGNEGGAHAEHSSAVETDDSVSMTSSSSL